MRRAKAAIPATPNVAPTAGLFAKKPPVDVPVGLEETVGSLSVWVTVTSPPSELVETRRETEYGGVVCVVDGVVVVVGEVVVVVSEVVVVGVVLEIRQKKVLEPGVHVRSGGSSGRCGCGRSDCRAGRRSARCRRSGAGAIAKSPISASSQDAQSRHLLFVIPSCSPYRTRKEPSAFLASLSPSGEATENSPWRRYSGISSCKYTIV